MKKISLVAVSLLTSMALNLNAATIATYNGKNVSDKDLAEYFAPMLGGTNFKTLPAQQQKQLAQEYILQQLIIEDAKKQKLEKDPLYFQELEKAKDGILLNIYQKKILDSIKVDSSKVKAFYDQNKDKYVMPARVQARHILVSTEKEARDIINQLKGLRGKALEDKFSELARTKSIDSGTAAQGGELGWFDKLAIEKPFADAAFALKNGTITTTPVKLNNGYDVILKENSQAQRQITFGEARQGIENGFKLEEFKNIMSQKGQALFSAAKVEIK